MCHALWCSIGCNSESSREASERGLVSLSIAVVAAAAVAAAVLQISATPLWMTSCATHRQIYVIESTGLLNGSTD